MNDETAGFGPPFLFVRPFVNSISEFGYNDGRSAVQESGLPMANELKQHRKSRSAPFPPLLQEAVNAHQAGKLELAQPLYRRFLADNAKHPTALQLLGLLHSQRGEYSLAIELMRESLRQFPQQAEVLNNLGNALAGCGRFKEAVDSYTQAIRLYPRYADAFRNLGLSYLQLDIVEDARRCFQRCIDLHADDAAAWLGLGNVHKRQNDPELAIQCFEKALLLRPDYAEAHHNLGVCLGVTQRTSDALQHYNHARRLGLDRAELYHNLGGALVEAGQIGAAIDAYGAAIQRNPEDLISHRDLNNLLWEQGVLENYLDSYREALDKLPDSVPLCTAYAAALNQNERLEDAERVLMQGLQRFPDASALKGLLAYTLEGQQRWRDALQMHASAVAMPDSIPDHRISYARALLACQRPEEALQLAREGARQIPFDQRALAYLGLCWRMLDDERDAVLNQYDRFIQVFEVPVPKRFTSIAEFNEKLAAILQPLHGGTRHLPRQTFRGGSRSRGTVLNRHEPEIAELVAGMAQCIQEYIARLPRDSAHPLCARIHGRFDFADSWSVCLQRGGCHTMHIHQMGWISSAYYVQVPSETTGTDSHGGGITFGEPDINIGEHGMARRIIQPVQGRLILFPSYMWHGTVPFDADEPRTAIAFDVVPGSGTSARH